MFLLVWLLSVANSDAGTIKLKEPMIVHTNDGDKYLYNPTKSDIKTKQVEVQNRISKLSEIAQSVAESDEEIQEDTCTWGEWAEFSKCESIAGELTHCHFPLLYS